jgi:hypothetical protein
MNVPAPTNPDTYWVEPGRLLAGEYPRDADETRARQKLQALLEAGVQVFVDLTEPGERGLVPYAPLLDEARATGHDVTHHRRSIPDVSVPSATRMREILSLIEASMAEGKGVYVHCWGGTGRTGTVVGCWLVEQGKDEGAPIGVLQALRRACRKRFRPSPDTDEQEAFVTAWGAQRGRSASHPRGRPGG